MAAPGREQQASLVEEAISQIPERTFHRRSSGRNGLDESDFIVSSRRRRKEMPSPFSSRFRRPLL